MSLLLARIIVSVGIFVAPFLLYTVASRDQNAGIILIFPFFGAIPAIVAALVLFWPIELFLDARGLPYLKNFLVPLAGAAIVFLFVFVMGAVWGNLGTMLAKMTAKGAWGVLSVWSVLGAIWGLTWRATEWIAKAVGLVNG